MENIIANKESWKNVEMPNESINLDLEINLNEQELELLKKGHIPEEMEDHWFMYFENNKLYIHRSWTGFCLYIISVSENGMICNAQVNRNKEQYTNLNDNYDKYMIASLIYKLVDRKDESRVMFDKALESQKNNDNEDENQNIEEIFPDFPEFEDTVVKNDMVDNKEESNKNKVQDFMNKVIDEYKEDELSEEDKEFNKYCELYEKKYGKHAYIAEPSGTKEQTINAIKICLEKNEDLLDEILYPKQEYKDEMNTNVSLTEERNNNIFKRIINAIKRIFNKGK